MTALRAVVGLAATLLPEDERKVTAKFQTIPELLGMRKSSLPLIEIHKKKIWDPVLTSLSGL